MKRVAFAAALVLALVLAACSPSSSPQVGGQTNWLLACATSDDCGDLDCVCGACTTSCETDETCAELPGASCVAPSDEGAIALCAGQAPRSSLCLARCAETCTSGTSCVAGICAPDGEPTVVVTVDSAAHHQTLIGFGAALAYAEQVIVDHPQKAALYNLLFAESGLDMLRLRNGYEEGVDVQLLPTPEIIDAASQRLGRRPVLFMTSGSPPATLKANASRRCSANPDTCTLISLPSGGFDYAGFAGFWRESLEAYAGADLLPDYVGIQNNPNWVPTGGYEACRFLPEEGTTMVSIDGMSIEVTYPGYVEALTAVREAIADLPVTPQLAGPEANGVGPLGDYLPSLGAALVDAYAFHVYDLDASNVDVAALEAVRELAELRDRPVFQTEMQADGPDTAVLMHYALTAGGASVYLQNDLVYLTEERAEVALVLLTEDGFEIQAPYYALSHYAKHTDPGWIRVDADSDSSELLSSAWLSPDGDALTVVMVNPGSEQLTAEVALDDALRARLARTDVTRTVFDGVERSAALGELSPDGVVRLPPRSILTLSLASD